MSFSKITQSVVVILALVSLFVACTGSDKNNQGSSIQVNAREIVDNESLTPEQKSDELTTAGEMLFTPESFFLADRVFAEALALNPENKKAELYREMMKPMLNLKGIMTRVKPLMAKDEVENEAFLRNYNNEDYVRRSTLLDQFLKDGEEDISTESELQDFLDSQISLYNNLRVYLRNNKDMNVSLNISAQWAEQRRQNRGYICQYTVIGDLNYEYECRANGDHMIVKVDRGDLEALKNMAAGMQVYLTLATSYSAAGSQEFIKETRNKLLSDKQRIEAAVRISDKLGTLRESHRLNSVLDLGLDGMAGLRWAQDNQDTLCPLPTEGSTFVFDHSKSTYHVHQSADGTYNYSYTVGKQQLRRPGYLFDEGFCTYANTTETGRLYNVIENAIKGQVVETRTEINREVPSYTEYNQWIQNENGEWVESDNVRGYTNVAVVATGEKVTANIKPSVLFNSPIQDVRSILPSEYNDCGSIKNFSDNTLGGLFVDGDAATFLSAGKVINKQEGFCTIDM
ncbi:MAG: hypothetical protein HRT44_00575 [Bdellovibrionales bacterium]|nr:hypothetical protein [Bdellovibrionales bacterium]NQZ17745.1 hypothetical protein [Bdellovibrionales bacterium]